jgi:protein phosphatase
MRFAVYGESDTGRVRKRNEDSIDWYLDRDELNALAVLADGVGGVAGGNVASQLAVEHIRQTVRDRLREGAVADVMTCIAEAIDQANAAILESRSHNPELAQMATTVVVGLALGEQLVLAHIGDSRCYRLRAGDLVQLTQDDTVSQQMLDNGTLAASQAGHTSYSHILTRSLGTTDRADPHIQKLTVQPDDLYIFCSDGLTDMINDTDMAEILQQYGMSSRCTGELIQRANDAGGNDNISVMLLNCIE